MPCAIYGANSFHMTFDRFYRPDFYSCAGVLHQIRYDDQDRPIYVRPKYPIERGIRTRQRIAQWAACWLAPGRRSRSSAPIYLC